MSYYLKVTNLKKKEVSLFKNGIKTKTWKGKLNIKEYKKLVSGDNLVLTSHIKGIY